MSDPDITRIAAPVAVDHRSFPDAGDGRPMPPMGDDLMTAGLSHEDARFVALQLAQNGLTIQPAAQVQAEAVAVVNEEINTPQRAAFWAWLPLAYRDGHVGTDRKFTKYNMEVAHLAGWQHGQAEVRKATLMEAARKATSFLVGDPANGIPLRNPMAHEVEVAILALIDKESAHE